MIELLIKFIAIVVAGSLFLLVIISVAKARRSKSDLTKPELNWTVGGSSHEGPAAPNAEVPSDSIPDEQRKMQAENLAGQARVLERIKAQPTVLNTDPPPPAGGRDRFSSNTRRRGRKREDPFYDSPKWRAVRLDALARDGGKCVLCGRRANHGVELHVDHIKPRSKYPELELEPSNLQVLCKDCNLGKSNRYEEDWRE